jgi:glycosyltransferase involved in cell wall biosynthesis
MLFSVLIANYNNAAFIEYAIQSVIAQTHEDWEIILVDDCSSDNFDNVIAPYLNHKKIKIYRNVQNMGCGFTKRRCASLAAGKFLGFLDPDDGILPHCLEIMTEEHRLNPDHSIIYSTHYICNEKMERIRIADYPRPLEPGLPYLFVSDGRIHAFASFKKDLYENTTGISELNLKAVDQDLYYLMEETGPVKFINQPLYEYRIHRNSISTMGKEKEATLWHYDVIMKACKRRIDNYAQGPTQKYNLIIRNYKSRYHKVGALKSFRKNKFLSFLYHLLKYSFSGGISNITSYLKKIPKERMNLFKKTFFHDHTITTNSDH